MAIKMQGTWLVRVKANNAGFPQEFVVSGASSGNGSYAGTSTAEIAVTGSSWSITIRHNPGSGFVASQMKLKFPTTSGGFRQFDIQSNDSGNDQDFNDLILTCRTPVSANDHIVFGHVSDYAGRCFFNPCNSYWVIDTPMKLQEALAVPTLRKYLLELYPDLLRRIPLPWPPDPIGPIADMGINPQPFSRAKFVPVTVPVPGELATPLKQNYLVRIEEKMLEIAGESTKKQGKAAGKSDTLTYQAVKSLQALPQANITHDLVALNRSAAIAGAIAPFRICDRDTLANVRIRFWEYDRTEAEKSGAAYSGEGQREYLGSTHTDDFGNYIFRFTTTSNDVLDEVFTDLAPGEDAFVVQAPDVIAEVMQPSNPFLPAFETAPYWNIPTLKRINICVPREKIGVRQLPCNGLHIIQFVGNLPLGAPAGAVRNSADTALSSIGVITSTNAALTTNCAAWNGLLRLRGCLANPLIKYYTLEHRRLGASTWENLNIHFTSPGFNGVSYFNGQVNQGLVGLRSIYLNIENATGGWFTSNIKAEIETSIFPAAENGPREIRITGLDAAYNVVGAPANPVQETVTLFILNNGIDVDIKPEITMAGTTITECGLFTLPPGVENPPITVQFKAVQSNVPPVYGSYGFMGSYEVELIKGASGDFDTTNPANPANPRTAGACELYFHGTNDEPSNIGGYVDLELSPASGHWLDKGQTFCTFGVYLNGRLRRTDGQHNEPNSPAVPVLFGIQR